MDSIAQSRGHIIRDSTLSMGYLGYGFKNPSLIKYALSNLNFRENAIMYTADEIDEFYISDSRQSFHARRIEGTNKKVFLELLSSGTITLYKLINSSDIYIEKEQLIRVTKDNYQDLLLGLTNNCDPAIINNLTFSRKGITTFVTTYNKHGACTAPPSKAYGLFAGYRMSTMSVDESSKYNPHFSGYEVASNSITLGAFAQFPLWSFKGFYVYPQIQFHQQKYNDSFSENNRDLGVKIHQMFITSTVPIKYQLNAGIIQPFIFAGPAFGYVLTQESEYVFAQLEPDGNTFYEEQNDWFEQEYLFYGPVFGGGLQFRISSSNRVNIEYEMQVLQSAEEISYRENTVQLKITF